MHDIGGLFRTNTTRRLFRSAVSHVAWALGFTATLSACGNGSNGKTSSNTQNNPQCAATEVLCEGDAARAYCSDLQVDNANCGICGLACATADTCVAGHCEAVAPTQCPSGETLCSGDADAGTAATCAVLDTDNANCGCCGNACSQGSSCQNGRCDTSTNFSFFVFGDMHVGPTSFNATVQVAMAQMAQIDSAAVAAFDNGDLVDFPSDEQWGQHDDAIAAMGMHLDTPCILSFGSKARYFGSVGDHDCDIASWYDLWSQHLWAAQGLGYHAADGVYYSVRYANALFIMLDSEHPSDAQNAWLQTAFESTEAQGAQLKFVFAHEPIYSCSSRHAPLAAGLPWVDIAEQYGVNVMFGSHTHVYTRSCPKRAGSCTGDATGVVFVETGAVGGEPREPDVVNPVTVTGLDASGVSRSDTYNCVVGQDLAAANGLANDFCHVAVEGCQAKVDCYVVQTGNVTPFDSWTIDGCQ